MYETHLGLSEQQAVAVLDEKESRVHLLHSLASRLGVMAPVGQNCGQVVTL